MPLVSSLLFFSGLHFMTLLLYGFGSLVLIILYLVFQITTEMEFDLDKALEDVPIHMEDTSSRTPPTPSQLLPKPEHRLTGGMVELPSEEEKKLQHFTKLRPRRNKKTHSSKVPVSKVYSSSKRSWISFTGKIKLKWKSLGKKHYNISCNSP